MASDLEKTLAALGLGLVGGLGAMGALGSLSGSPGEKPGPLPADWTGHPRPSSQATPKPPTPFQPTDMDRGAIRGMQAHRQMQANLSGATDATMPAWADARMSPKGIAARAAKSRGSVPSSAFKLMLDKAMAANPTATENAIARATQQVYGEMGVQGAAAAARPPQVPPFSNMLGATMELLPRAPAPQQQTLPRPSSAPLPGAPQAGYDFLQNNPYQTWR